MSQFARPALTILALQAACGGASPSASPVLPAPIASTRLAPEAQAAAVQNAEDTMTTTAWGDTFTAPKGWSVSQTKTSSVLTDPDKQITVTLRAEQAVDAERAAAQAWAGVDPGFARKVASTSRPNAADGWDEIVQLSYEVPASEGRTVMAVLRRAGATWHVFLLTSSNAGLGRRGAQVAQVVESYKAPGIEAESFAGRKAHALTGERLAAFDAFVESARTQLGIPGMAVAVVQEGKIAFEKGYGVRTLGKPEKVTPHTRFMIGSTTKSLTSLMMARRIDAGAYLWDTPVTTLMPAFALGDATATQKLLLRHTVCACTGMPRQDFEFFFQPPTVTPETRISRMRTMKPTTGFGDVFQYSNALVGAGGYIAARGYGGKASLADSYDLAMRKEVFEPLGMSETSLDVASVLRAEHAMPSAMGGDGVYRPITLRDEAGVQSVAPAGAAWSSVRDMAMYTQLELAKGVGADGARYVSEANLLKRRERQVKITDEMGYGLGLFVGMSHGVQRVGHAGNNLGFTSEWMFLPEQQVGLVLLFNAGSARRSIFERKLWEVLFDGKPESQAMLDAALRRAQTVVSKNQKERDLDPGSAWLGRWAGSYKNDELGTLSLTVKGKSATMQTAGWSSAVAKKAHADGGEGLVAVTPPWDDFEFTPSADKITGLRTLTFNGDEQHPYVFTEVKK